MLFTPRIYFLYYLFLRKNAKKDPAWVHLSGSVYCLHIAAGSPPSVLSNFFVSGVRH